MRNALITGANRGIGLALAQELGRRGYRVLGTSRGPAPELEEVAEVLDLDIAVDSSVTALARQLADTPIHLLVHNAGLLSRETLDDMDVDRLRAQLEVNAIGPIKLTAALRHLLVDGGKIAFLTSRMGSIADNTTGGSYGYRMSKAALNAAGVSLAHDLAPRRIAVVLLHPGYVRTGMTGGRGDWEPEEAAVALADRIEELSMDSTGRFLHAKGHELPW